MGAQLAFLQVLQQLHPLGLNDDWADKLAGQEFIARNALTTFEHYMQVGPHSPSFQSIHPTHHLDADPACRG